MTVLPFRPRVAEVAMSQPSRHYLIFGPFREITGCACGFLASTDDHGYGNSVVEHLLGGE